MNSVHSAPSTLPPTGFKLSGPSEHLSTVCADCLGIEMPLEFGQRNRCPYAHARTRIPIPILLPEVHLEALVHLIVLDLGSFFGPDVVQACCQDTPQAVDAAQLRKLQLL